MQRLLPIIGIAALSTVACQKESSTSTPPTPTPTPAPVPVVLAEVAVASVTVQQDCPDPQPAKPAAMEKSMAAPSEDMDEAMGDVSENYVAPCTQSSLQIAITGQGETSSEFSIKEVRILGPKGKTLDVIGSRLPTIWKDNTYVPWNQVILPKTDVKASYKLGFRGWRTVEETLGGSSYGPAFIVEADVEVGGTTKTIRSAPVIREPEEMIQT